MSNLKILDRLVEEILTFDKSNSDIYEFSQRFMSHIEALENIPYSEITKAREWQYQFEMAALIDGEEFVSDYDVVIKKIVKWLSELNKHV